jgi:hypothetical protein
MKKNESKKLKLDLPFEDALKVFLKTPLPKKTKTKKAMRVKK